MHRNFKYSRSNMSKASYSIFTLRRKCLGAHLYQGYLPWDDDVDLMMTRENYNKFLSVIKQELPKGFSVHNYQLSDTYWSLYSHFFLLVFEKTYNIYFYPQRKV